MRFKLSIISFFISLSFYAQGQKKVSDPTFDKMLQNLLDHSVNEVIPEDCSSSKEIIYLDAREKTEYNVSHLPNAKWIGYDTFKVKTTKDIPKNAEIVVYCTVGYRSEKIAERLLKAGFSNVSNLYGGIFEWMHSGNKVIKDSITKNVHTYDKEWSKWLKEGNGNKIY